MRTLFVYLLALCAVGVGAWFAFPEIFGAEVEGETSILRASSPEDAPPVVAVQVREKPFADTLEALGTVLANESVTIRPNRADQVVAIHFDDGDTVEQGQLLVELNAEEERAQLAEAIAIRDERRQNLDRSRELLEGNLLSEGDFDAARASFAAAEARVASLEASIADSLVHAPFSGVLGLRQISPGAFVEPAMILTTLDDLSVVKLDFTIPETWLREVQAGMTVQATSAAWPGELFGGRVVRLDTRLDAATRSLVVRALLPNPDARLRPGMLLEVQVQRGEGPVLQIPEEAAIPVGSDEFVFVVDDDGIAHRVQIRSGRRRPGVIEILDGLEAGQNVVIEGIVRVRDEKPVRVVATREP